MSILALLACGPAPEALLASGRDLAPTDPRAAAGPLGEACDAGLVEACDAAGALPLDDPRIRSWNERACEGDIAAACARRSESPGDDYRERACGLGDGASCAARATTLEGPARDGLLGRACEAGHVASCLPAADAARAAGDPERAVSLYATACRASPESAACLLAERVRADAPPGEAPPWPEGDPAAVSEALWARCAANEAWGCLQLADHVEHRGGPLPAASRGDAAWLRNQACDLQLTYACAPHAW